MDIERDLRGGSMKSTLWYGFPVFIVFRRSGRTRDCHVVMNETWTLERKWDGVDVSTGWWMTLTEYGYIIDILVCCIILEKKGLLGGKSLYACAAYHAYSGRDACIMDNFLFSYVW